MKIEHSSSRRRILDEELFVAFDGMLGGWSLHLIAIYLYVEREVAEKWGSDRAIRGRVRWRVKRGFEMMNGGCRALAAGWPR